MTATDTRSDFLARLLDGGILVRSAARGVYGKGADFVRTFDALDRFVTGSGAGAGPELFRFPPVMPRVEIVRTDYVRSFPDLVGSIHSFDGDDRDHAQLLRAIDDEGDWSATLATTDVMLVPAACYPLYPMLAGRLPDGGRLFDVLGTCFRHEPSDDPARMQIFHQHEYVRVGTPSAALTFRDHWLAQSQQLMTDLGLDVRAVVANDPFFGRGGRMLAVNQREEALKFEVVATVADPERPTAIVSCNCHQDHLTSRFGITTVDGELAHSACVGFGLERIVLALFSAHGLDVGRWPAAVKERLAS